MSDYVTKDAVQRVITHSAAKLYMTGQISKEESPKLVAYVLNAVEKMPGINLPEQKCGVWNPYDDGDGFGYQCSACQKVTYGCSLEIFVGDFKFCPCCGASMRNTE